MSITPEQQAQNVNLQLCSVKRLKQLSNIPLPRYNPVSPYVDAITGASTGITQSQVDMRRKVEILKYSSNRMPNQTNNLTKKQSWSMLVKSKTQKINVNQPNTVCPDPAGIYPSLPVLTTASDIPGPPMYLYEDPTVPLYNYYGTPTYAYDDVAANVPYWQPYIYNNVVAASGLRTFVFGVDINDTINKPKLTFSVDVPIALHAEGTLYGTTAPPPITVTIATAVMDIYCNDVYISSLKQTASLSNWSMQFRLPTPGSGNTGKSFAITQYLGDLSFNGIVLSTSPIYRFQFALTLNLVVGLTSSVLSSYFTNPAGGSSTFRCYGYGNYTSATPIVATNCTNVYVSPRRALVAPSIVGV